VQTLAVGVPTWGDVGGGFDVWLPLYVLLALLLVMVVSGWRLTLRRALVAIAAGMLWSWSVNPLGVIPAAASAVLAAVVAGAVIRHRRRAAGAGPA
jgi:hypothetical protein